MVKQGNHPDYPWSLNDGGSLTNKGTEYEDIANQSRDLVRKIVVGQNWKPWNGHGVSDVPMAAICQVIYRSGRTTSGKHDAPWLWEHHSNATDIVAFRTATAN